MTAARGEHLSFVADRGLQWIDSPNSAAHARRGFCSECGSSLFWDAPDRETISIAAGTIDEPTGLKTTMQIYTADAGDYYELDPALEAFDGSEDPGSRSLPDMPSYLHTCYRIGDIDRSVSFYEKLGFEERRRMPIGDDATNVFMGLPGEDPVLELTYNHGVDSYDLGTGYNHIALAVEDLEGTLEALASVGIEPEKPPYRPGGRTEGPFIAFVRDPDGYRVELIGRDA
jgi:lactoylglutathione lyase